MFCFFRKYNNSIKTTGYNPEELKKIMESRYDGIDKNMNSTFYIFV